MLPMTVGDSRSMKIILIGILIGIILGGFLGYTLGERMLWAAFFGKLFLNALKMIVIPLIITSMVTGVAALGDIRKLGGTAVKTLGYYFLTTIIAVTIGIVCVNIIQPGVGQGLFFIGQKDIVDAGQFSISRFFLSLVPTNIFKAMAETDVLPLIIFSLFFGAVLTTIGQKGRIVIDIFDALNDVIMKMVHLIMYIAPIGVFGLVAGKIAEASVPPLNPQIYHDMTLFLKSFSMHAGDYFAYFARPLTEGGGHQVWLEILKVGKYSLTIIIGLAIHGFIVLPLILTLLAKRNPLKYGYGVSQAVATAFSTASSSATLPITLECVEKNNGVNNKAASFVLPLGATINMDGTALYEAVAAIFIAQLYGIELSFAQQIIIVLTATLAAVGAAGIPQAGLVTMVIVLQSVNLPVEGIASILAVDWLLDRFRTSVNVWGDTVGAAVIERTREISSP
jgi:solute carrier family 1 (high affinity glutamate transporter) protein 1